MMKMIRSQYTINAHVDTPLGEALTTGWGLASKEIVEVRLMKYGIVKMFDKKSIAPIGDAQIELSEMARS